MAITKVAERTVSDDLEYLISVITVPLHHSPITPAVAITKVAERTISDDLEYLISKTVDTGKADYAVVTGIQIHNWGADFKDQSPNMEFVQVGGAGLGWGWLHI